MNQKNIVMVGLGGISRTHLHHLRQCSALKLVGGIDTSQTQRTAFEEAEGVPSFESLEAALECLQVDGLIVATPPSARESIILSALDRGIAVLSEKPLASNLDTAMRLAAHPKASQLLRVGYCHRWTGAAQAARQMIKAGELGDVVFVNICFSGWMPTMATHWMTHPPLSGGGALMDNGCHALDLFAYLAGDLHQVCGTLRHSWEGRGDDSFALSAYASGGAVGSLIGSYLHSAPRNEWEVVGTQGTLRYSYDKASDTLVFSSNADSRVISVAAPGLRFARQLDEWQRHLFGEITDMPTPENAVEINRWISAVQG